MLGSGRSAVCYRLFVIIYFPIFKGQAFQGEYTAWPWKSSYLIWTILMGFITTNSKYVFLMSIIVQQDATIYSFIIFLQTAALHVSGDTLTHHQEHTQTVITASGTGRTVFATACWRGGVGTPSRLLHVVITVWMCSWWWMRLSSETCRAVCRNITKLYIVASRWTIIDIDSRCTDPFTMHGPIHDARTHVHKTFPLPFQFLSH